MSEIIPAVLNHFSLFTFRSSFYELPESRKVIFLEECLHVFRSVAQRFEIYQVFLTQTDADFLVWYTSAVNNPPDAKDFFISYAAAINPLRRFLNPVDTYWGFTKSSQYTKARSSQEIDSLFGLRQPYLVLYPFAKTSDWYLMSREARQGMMNEHIRIGKSFSDIDQLLLYSFGLQDHEFVVVYEMPDMKEFSDLVYELRASEARRFTLKDTPLVTAINHPAKEILDLWK